MNKHRIYLKKFHSWVILETQEDNREKSIHADSFFIISKHWDEKLHQNQ